MNLNESIDRLREDLIQSTCGILKIKSIEEEGKEGKPFGEGVAKALDYALKVSQSLGFKTVNLDGYAGYAEYGEGEDYVAVLGHLDVVPEGDGWKYPPYAAEIHDGKIYARGSLDDKGPIMACLYGLKAIADCGIKTSKKIRVIFGTNEETGSKDMEHYMKHEKAPIAGFTPDAEYPIIFAEKGLTVFSVVKELKNTTEDEISILDIRGGQRANIVPDYCEALIKVADLNALQAALTEFKTKHDYDISLEIKDSEVLVKSIGVSAHGSLPHKGKNAIMQLFAFLTALPIGNGDLAQFIRFLHENAGMDTTGAQFGVGLQDEASGKLSFNVGTVSMDNNKITMVLNLRYPVTYKLEDMMNPFNQRLQGTGIVVEDMEHQSPLYFPKDHILIKTLQKVYSEQTGMEPKLLAIGGGTYAKEMPNIVAFGPVFPGKPDIVHEANEYIEVEDLVLNAKIYAHAMAELAK